MGLTYNQLYEKVDSLLLENDYLANKILAEREHARKYAILQNYVTFNAFDTLGQLGWYSDFIQFVNNNGEQLKRKLELDEFLKYAMRFRIVSFLSVPKDFADFKSIKIKKAISQ